MNHDQAKKIINEYADGRLPPDEASELKKHIDECRECSEMIYELRNLLNLIKQLPEKITPPHDLWKDIFHQIHDLKVVQIKKEEDERPVEEEPDEEEEKQKEESRKEFAKAKDKKEKEERKKEKEDKRKEKDSHAAKVYNLNELFKKYKIVITTASAILLLGILFFLIKSITGNITWEISGTPGLYRINNQIGAGSELSDGDVLETLNSAAVIIIPEAGRVQVDPDSRIEKAGKKNLNLTKGSIAVESTGSGEPITADVFSSEVVQAEPGSYYKVQISEDNTADLKVSSGRVLIRSGSLKSIVIPGYICKITGNGPEVPINQNAADRLRTALKKLSFDGDPASLNTVLNESAATDALSLWHLFERIHGDNIDEVYVKLYSLVTPPKGVDQESILRLKQEALASWLGKIITSN